MGDRSNGKGSDGRDGMIHEGEREGRVHEKGSEPGVSTKGSRKHDREGEQREAGCLNGKDRASDSENERERKKRRKGMGGEGSSGRTERKHREKRRGGRRGVASSSESGSVSESKSETTKSRRKEKVRASQYKSRGEKRAKEREKGIRDSDLESSSGSESEREKRKERSRERSRHRSSRRKQQSSKKGRRNESGSDTETGSDSEDRRTRDRRKKKEKKEKKRRKHREKQEGKRDATGQEQMEKGMELDQPERSGVNRQQEAARQAVEDLKMTMRQNAEVARARLAGEVERARAEQMAMLNEFGAVDGRAVKKLNAEKRKLKSMVKAGHKLEALEAKEAARMDAFRVAMGLPTAEAQRQAEWRAEATQQAALLNATSAYATSAQEPGPRRTLGPAMPGGKHKTSSS